MATPDVRPRSTPPDGDLTLRALPYSHPDAQRLAAELEAEIAERYRFDDAGGGEVPEVMATWAVRPSQMTPPNGVFVIAYLAEQPVGCGALRPLVQDSAGRLVPTSGGAPLPAKARVTAEIKRMYVAPPARGRGVSRAVLDRLEREAAALGYHRAQLETGQRQPEAIKLYESTGWERITPYGQYADDPLSVCFAKAL